MLTPVKKEETEEQQQKAARERLPNLHLFHPEEIRLQLFSQPQPQIHRATSRRETLHERQSAFWQHRSRYRVCCFPRTLRYIGRIL